MIDGLTSQISIVKNQIETDKKKILEDTQLSNQLSILEAGEQNKVEKKNLRDQKKAIDANIKLMRASVLAKEQQLNNIELS